MPLPTLFASATSATGAQLDADLAAVGLLGVIPCTIAGTNTLTLTPLISPASPTIPAYQNYMIFAGVASNANTGAVTAAAAGLGALAVFKDTAAGPVALTGGEIKTANLLLFLYDSSLAAGAGGLHLQTAPSATVGTVTNVATGTGLTGGPITTTGTLSLAQIANLRLLANVSGGAAVPSANTLTAILDAIISSTNGAMLQRVGGVWTAALRGQILGTATNDSAGAGDIGEYIAASVALGAPIALTTNVAANIASISLTAGDWSLSGLIGFTGGATTTVSVLSGSLSTTSATPNTTSGMRATAPSSGGTPFNLSAVELAIPPTQISLGGTTTVYLVALATFGTSTCAGYGMLSGRRAR